jgi:cytochrome c oxidase assembly protein subunit 15
MASHAQHPDEPAPADGWIRRFRAAELDPAQFRRIALAALVWIFLVVTTGAVVRLTGSGLGCDHWPRCGSTPFPEKGAHAFIEFGNRVIGAITIGFTLLAWLAARRTPGLSRRVERLALVIFIGTTAQIPLGGLTVILKLNPLLVMTHFLLALLMLGAAVVVVVEAHGFTVGTVPPLVPHELQKIGLLLGGACLALVVSGAFATAAGPHAGDSSKIHRLGTPITSVTAHAVVTGIFSSAFLFVLGYLAARRSRSPRLFAAAVLLLGVLLVQVALGETQYRTGLPWWLVLVHVFMATAVWGGTVALVTLFFRPTADLAPPT